MPRCTGKVHTELIFGYEVKITNQIEWQFKKKKN